MQRSIQRSVPVLWGLVIILLALNVGLLYGLNLARLTVVDTLAEVEAMVNQLAHEVIIYDLEVNQAVPMKADIPFNRTMEIPLDTVIPIDQVFAIPVQTPTGEIILDVPLKTDFPVKMVVPVDFHETIDVDTTVQLNTTIPVEIDIAKTTLVHYLNQAGLNIAQLRSRLAPGSLPVGGTEIVAGRLAPDQASQAETALSPKNDRQSQPASDDNDNVTVIEPIAPPASASEVDQEVNPSANSSNAAVSIPDEQGSDAENLTPQPAPQSDLGLCSHAYWPLRPGTLWAYNSPETSYTQKVDSILNNQVHLNTQYEGQEVRFSLICYQEGLGGNYLGDMRRLTELGVLTFSNPHGMFLPRPEVMETLGRSWTQNYDVSGTVEARQADNPNPIKGAISRGQAVAVYTPTGFESVATPLGPRDALRIEQKLTLDLDINFEVSGQVVATTEVVNLGAVYWFARGIGPVKMHWQGGAIQQTIALESVPAEQQSVVPALIEDQLAFVCISEDETVECMHVTGIAEGDLTNPSSAELTVQRFTFPVWPSDAGPAAQDSLAAVIDDDRLSDLPTDADLSADRVGGGRDDNNQQALSEYIAAIAYLRDQISGAAEGLFGAALAYQADQLSRDQFRSQFQSFSSEIKGPISEFNKLSPPPAAESLHQKLADGLAKCNQAIDVLDDWFDTADGSARDKGIDLATDCMETMSEAKDELSDLAN